jgi:hypothetical protein
VGRREDREERRDDVEEPEKPDSKPRTILSRSIDLGPISSCLPKSFAPASAPSTTSRFTAAAKRAMKRVERAP